MKAMVVSPLGGHVPPNRGVLRRDLEAEEVAAYLTKLRSLVPDMPRKRKLSKLEVIQRVIEYICYLQTALEETNAHQDAKTVGATTTTTTTTTTTMQSVSRQPLQPLLNTTGIVSTTTSTIAATSITAATIAER